MPSDEHGTVGVADDLVGHAAQEDAGDAAASVASNDHQVCVTLFSPLDNDGMGDAGLDNDLKLVGLATCQSLDSLTDLLGDALLEGRKGKHHFLLELRKQGVAGHEVGDDVNDDEPGSRRLRPLVRLSDSLIGRFAQIGRDNHCLMHDASFLTRQRAALQV